MGCSMLYLNENVFTIGRRLLFLSRSLAHHNYKSGSTCSRSTATPSSIPIGISVDERSLSARLLLDHPESSLCFDHTLAMRSNTQCQNRPLLRARHVTQTDQFTKQTLDWEIGSVTQCHRSSPLGYFYMSSYAFSWPANLHYQRNIQP